MKILHICETAKGGVGAYVDTLIAAQRSGDEHLTVLPKQHRAVLRDSAKCDTFEYRKRSALSLAYFMWTSLSATLRFRPDVVFCHSTFALCALALLKAISPRTAFIYCPHGWAGLRVGARGSQSALARLIEAKVCGLADTVVNVSATELGHARSHRYCGRHILIENAVLPACETMGAEPRQLAHFDPDALNLLFVGRHDFQKGLDILLAAYAKISQQRPDIRLHIIGEAVLADNARKVPSRDKNVNWLGWVARDQIDAFYKAVDVLVVPSRCEGLPLVIPEALRNGTPVLVSNRSGLPQLIAPGETGLVFELDSQVLASTLLALDKSNLRSMREACLKLFNRRFHAERLAAELHRLYDVLAGATRPGLLEACRLRK